MQRARTAASPDHAERIYLEILKVDPKNADAYSELGMLAAGRKRFHAAVEYLSRAVKFGAKSPALLNNLATSMILSGRHEAALPHLRKTIRLDPDLVEAHLNMGRVQRKLGNGELALQSYEKASSIAPDMIAAHLGHAETLVELGRIDDAVDAFREILHRHPDNVAAASGMALARKFTSNDTDDIELLQRCHSLKQGDASAAAVRIHHAMGKVYDDLARFDFAFEHYDQAKVIAGADFDLDKYRGFVDLTIQKWTAFDFIGGGGSTSDVPVFIVGMPRSGSTLTEQIIASHPAAFGAGEVSYLGSVARDLVGTSPRSAAFADRLKKTSSERLQGVARKYLLALSALGGSARRITDKTNHNFELLAVVAKLFPNARVVHCLRNPVDNCFSCFTHNFNEKHGYNSDLRKLGYYYREYARLMDHWEAALPLKIHRLQYEEMTSDPEEKMRELIDFVGLKWHDDCLRFYDTKRTVTTPSRAQVRRPVYTSSVQRWKNYEAHLGDLRQALGDLAD